MKNLLLFSLLVSSPSLAAPSDDFRRAAQAKSEIDAETRIHAAVEKVAGRLPGPLRVQIGADIIREWEEADSEGGRHRYSENQGKKFWASATGIACQGELRNFEGDKADCLAR